LAAAVLAAAVIASAAVTALLYAAGIAGGSTTAAVPIDPVKAELSQLEAGKTVPHPYLGVALQEASINRQGAQVTTVASGSPAAAAGLKTGDLITALDGTAVIGPSQLVADVAALKPGEKVTLTVTRGANNGKLTATLSRQASQPAKPQLGKRR
jgi:putative serine protease PepD